MTQGRFFVFDEKLAGQAGLSGNHKGYTVRDQRGSVAYQCQKRSEAERICERFNTADQKSAR